MDQNSLSQTGYVIFPALFAPDMVGMVRWGNDGFAFLTNNLVQTSSRNQLIAFRSSLAHVTAGPNPAPGSLGTSVLTASDLNVLMQINGSNFVRGGVVNWNGNARTTAYVSATQLTAYISRADIATAGTYPIIVVNP